MPKQSGAGVLWCRRASAGRWYGRVAPNAVGSTDFVFYRVGGGFSLECLTVLDETTHGYAATSPPHAIGELCI